MRALSLLAALLCAAHGCDEGGGAARAERAVAAPDYIAAHRHSSHHRAEISRSRRCGCFYCRATFEPAEITEWVDGDQTAVCPRCGIDSVIGDASGYTLDDALLRRMQAHWF